MKKLRIGILFGGRSAEHEVSLQSAKNIINALDKEKYEVIPIGINKNGQWMLGNVEQLFFNENNPAKIQLASGETVALIPDKNTKDIVSLETKKPVGEIDIIFPVLHGTYGEDGTMQGLLKLANIPFVGANVLGSAVAMDKDVMKRLLRDAEIPIAKFLVVKKKDEIVFEDVVNKFGLPFFVKPANLGSSIGVSKVHNESEFEKAIDQAFSYDNKILIEEYIKGREVFCAVLGNEDILTSTVGELRTSHEFYDYEAKYVDEIQMKIPAALSQSLIQQIQELSKKVVKILCCEGMARVDIFVTDDNQLILNEINTIPGFTEHSWYPKLWEASGLVPKDLIDKLIILAIERHKRDQLLQTTRT